MLEVSGNEVDDLPHAFPYRSFRLRHRTINDWGQRDSGVMASEAGKNVPRHHPDQLTALGFEVSGEDLLQAPESL